ncbi:MAG: integrin alpha [Planctomycetota bacterium]
MQNSALRLGSLVLLALPAFGQSQLLASESTNEGALHGSALAFGDYRDPITLETREVLYVGEPYEAAAGLAGNVVAVDAVANGDLPDAFTIVDSVTGTTAGERFGAALSTSGDLDDDGVRDLLVGAPESGHVHAYSGVGLTEFPWSPIVEGVGRFGAAVAIIDDVDGDGLDDIAVGAPDLNALFAGVVGGVLIYRSSDGGQEALVTAPDLQAGASFGAALARVGDLDFDARGELLIGSPDWDAPGLVDAGRALVYGPFAEVYLSALELQGEEAGEELGYSVAAGAVDADELDDLIVGVPNHDFTFLQSLGRVAVVSGATGALVYNFIGVEQGRLGEAVAYGGDLNRDGRGDVLGGAPFSDNASGRVFGWSGLDGAELFSTVGRFSVGRLGSALAGGARGEGAGNGDLYADWAAGAPLADPVLPFMTANDGGAAFVFSGRREIRVPGTPSAGTAVGVIEDATGDGADDFVFSANSFEGGRLVDGETGFEQVEALLFAPVLDSAGDVDGDGRGDLLAGSPAADQAYLMTRTSGSIFLLETDYPGPGSSSFGQSVAGIGDVDLDGIPDAAVGAPDLPGLFGSPSYGAVYVFSNSEGAPQLFAAIGENEDERFGYSVAGLGDANLDGVPDVVVGGPDAESFGNQAGRAAVLSGADGTQLLEVFGSGLTGSSHAGWSVDGVGDVNLDGYPDFAVGEPDYSVFGGSALVGRVRVVSTADGSTLATLVGTQAGERLGYTVAGPGDIDRDGLPDFAAGAPFWDDPTLGADTGRVLLARGVDGLRLDDGQLSGTAGSEYGSTLSGRFEPDATGVARLAVGAPKHSGPKQDGLVDLLRLPLESGEPLGPLTGCGGTPLLSLDVVAIPGESMRLIVENNPNNFAYVSLSPPAPAFVPYPPDCTIVIDLATILATVEVLTLTGSGEGSLLLPNLTSLLGLDLAAQAFAVAPAGIGLSNGVSVEVGYAAE